MSGLRIGVNALYLIPGGVGGTEIYLRGLLAALARIDSANQYVVFTNRETGPDLVPEVSNFRYAPQDVRAVNRPARILWEQLALPIQARRHRLDLLFNPGFTAPLLAACPLLTVFHDLQHKRQPQNFRWFDLPFWRLLLWAAAHRSRHLLADSESTSDDRGPGTSRRRRFHGLDPPPGSTRAVRRGLGLRLPLALRRLRTARRRGAGGRSPDGVLQHPAAGGHRRGCRPALRSGRSDGHRRGPAPRGRRRAPARPLDCGGAAPGQPLLLGQHCPDHAGGHPRGDRSVERKYGASSPDLSESPGSGRRGSGVFPWLDSPAAAGYLPGVAVARAG
ncbi:MAG: glycosyltransferase [Acidobacteria bacterium]|nr:glycosyltransferase [Acidobacteriota bacterium]